MTCDPDKKTMAPPVNHPDAASYAILTIQQMKRDLDSARRERDEARENCSWRASYGNLQAVLARTEAEREEWMEKAGEQARNALDAIGRAAAVEQELEHERGSHRVDINALAESNRWALREQTNRKAAEAALRLSQQLVTGLLRKRDDTLRAIQENAQNRTGVSDAEFRVWSEENARIALASTSSTPVPPTFVSCACGEVKGDSGWWESREVPCHHPQGCAKDKP